MLRSLAIAAALVAVALPAAAASVTVNISGMDATAAHAKIERAAEEACRVAYSDESLVTQYYEHGACVTDAVAAAEAKLTESNRSLAKL